MWVESLVFFCCSFAISLLVLWLLSLVCTLVDFFPFGLLWIFSCTFLLHFSWYLLWLLHVSFPVYCMNILNFEKLYFVSTRYYFPTSVSWFFLVVAKESWILDVMWWSSFTLVVSVSGLRTDFFSSWCPSISGEKEMNVWFSPFGLFWHAKMGQYFTMLEGRFLNCRRKMLQSVLGRNRTGKCIEEKSNLELLAGF